MFHITPGPKQRGSSNRYNGGIGLIYREDAFSVTQSIVYKGIHQATHWIVTSPSLHHALHLTGVYCSPACEDDTRLRQIQYKHLQDLYDTIQQDFVLDDSSPHLFLGDFNAWIGEARESHITPSQESYIPLRRGDTNSSHRASPTTPSSSSPWLTSNLRGRFLLNFIQNNDLLVANGRFETPSQPTLPATLIRQRGNPAQPTLIRTIIDYILIGKPHWDSVQDCQILRGSHLLIGHDEDRPEVDGNCDHEMLFISLTMEGDPNLPTNISTSTKAPRTKFHDYKLKDKTIREKFDKALDLQASKLLPILQTRLQEYRSTPPQLRNPVTLVEALNSEFTNCIHHTAHTELGRPSSHGPQTRARPQNSRPAQTRPLAAEIRACTASIHAALAQQIPQAQIDALYLTLAHKKRLLRAAILQDQNSALLNYSRSGTLSFTMRGPTLNEAWSCLRKVTGKLSKCSITLPPFILFNTHRRTDRSIWRASDSPALTLHESGQAWHDFRHSLGHHLRHHAHSTFDEKEADRVEAELSKLNDTHTRDPLISTSDLDTPPSLEETVKTLHSLPPDKSVGIDGISNRMLQSHGKAFHELIHFMIGAVWELEVYPETWRTALVSPVHKGKGRPKVDPASYRGIYLTCHITKLFEALLLRRIIAHMGATKAATPYQFAQTGFQAHDAIYTLMSTILNNKTQHNAPTHCAFIDFETAFPSVHRDRLSLLAHAAGFRGKFWRLLRTSYQSIFIRVLHPGIPASAREEILRGIPEGSKLSPSLFNLFVAELLTELNSRFPDADTFSLGGRSWTGALAFVDDIVLVTRDPHQLQAMLNVCQNWCERSRMKINITKTNTMTFFPDDSSRSLSWHLTRRFPSPHQDTLTPVSCFKYLGVPLDDTLSMSPLKDDILDKIRKSSGKLSTTFKSFRSSQPGVSTLGQQSTSPSTRLQLWRSCVLTQATINLRYITSQTHLNEIQRALSKSLQKTMGCYDCPLALQGDLGVPPLEFFRLKEWARMHFRYSSGNAPQLTKDLYLFRHRQQYLSQCSEPEYTLETAITKACQRLFPTWALGSPLPEPRHLRTTHLQRKEKSFARSMHSRLSDLWRVELLPDDSTDFTLSPTSRIQAYAQLAQYDLQRRDLFRPAAYIHASPSVCTSALLRLRTQTSCHIPSHCKLGTMNGGRVSYRDFRDRHCHACPGACGDSAHYLTACPVTDQTILDTHRPVTNLLRQLRLPKWSSLPTPVQLSILAGSTLPTIWKSNQAGRWHWTTTLTPHTALLALRIEQQLKMALPSNL